MELKYVGIQILITFVVTGWLKMVMLFVHNTLVGEKVMESTGEKPSDWRFAGKGEMPELGGSKYCRFIFRNSNKPPSEQEDSVLNEYVRQRTGAFVSIRPGGSYLTAERLTEIPVWYRPVID